MPEGGDIVLVHWLGTTDYPLTGDEAAELFIGRSSAFRTGASAGTRGALSDRRPAGWSRFMRRIDQTTKRANAI